MVDRVQRYDITIPAQTLQTALLTTPMKFFQGEVTQINVKVPPGPAGNVGIYIAAGGTQYIPRNAGTFVIPDDDDLIYPVTNAIDSGDWALVGYNTDVNDHLIQVEFFVNELPIPGTVSTTVAISL